MPGSLSGFFMILFVILRLKFEEELNDRTDRKIRTQL